MKQHPFASLLVSVALTGACAAARGEDWPQFRGADGLGASSDKGVPVTWGPDRNLAWKTELPGAGASTPVVFGGRIYVTCYTGGPEDLERHLVCLDRGGKALWDRKVRAKLPEQPTIREDHGYATNTPAVDAERVYAFFGKSGVYAFDHDGKQLWHADVGSGLSGWGSAASPVLCGGLVVVNAGVESESLVALDKKTGEEVWRARGIKESWNTPLVVTPARGKPELVVAIAGKVLAFDPASGEALWSCATDIGWYMVPSLVAEDGVVYCIGGRTGGALAVRAGGRGDVTRTHRLWKIDIGSNVPSPVFHEGRLYWAHENLGIVYCVEGKTGRVVYEERLPRAGQVYASAVLIDGKIYYTTRQGRTFVVPAGPKFEVLAVNELGERERFDASPAVADGRLLIRSNRFLYCIGKE